MNARGIPRSTCGRKTKKQTKVLWPLLPPPPSLPTPRRWLPPMPPQSLPLIHPQPPPHTHHPCPPPTPLLAPRPTHPLCTVVSPHPQWLPHTLPFPLLSRPKSAASLLQLSPTPSAPPQGFRTWQQPFLPGQLKFAKGKEEKREKGEKHKRLKGQEEEMAIGAFPLRPDGGSQSQSSPSTWPQGQPLKVCWPTILSAHFPFLPYSLWLQLPETAMSKFFTSIQRTWFAWILDISFQYHLHHMPDPLLPSMLENRVGKMGFGPLGAQPHALVQCLCHGFLFSWGILDVKIIWIFYCIIWN